MLYTIHISKVKEKRETSYIDDKNGDPYIPTMYGYTDDPCKGSHVQSLDDTGRPKHGQREDVEEGLCVQRLRFCNRGEMDKKG